MIVRMMKGSLNLDSRFMRLGGTLEGAGSVEFETSLEAPRRPGSYRLVAQTPLYRRSTDSQGLQHVESKNVDSKPLDLVVEKTK